MAALRKFEVLFNSNLHIDKKIINIKKEDSMRKKLIQTLIFPKLPSAYEILIRRDVVNCIS